MCGQPVALLNRKDGEPLEEGNAARRLAGFDVGAAVLIARDEAACVNDADALLAAPDITAKRDGLSEGQEGVGRKAARDDRIPERENIDAAVTPLADGIVGHTDAGLCRSPGLDPGDAPRFQFGDRKSTRLNSSH